MLISVSGCTSRSFIIGITLAPPARIRAAGPNLASCSRACSTLVAFSYSTYAGTCMDPPSCHEFTVQAPGGPGPAAARPALLRPWPGTALRNTGDVMTLTQLNAFVLVARLGSVTAAANALGVSESAVWEALSALRLPLGDQMGR